MPNAVALSGYPPDTLAELADLNQAFGEEFAVWNSANRVWQRNPQGLSSEVVGELAGSPTLRGPRLRTPQVIRDLGPVVVLAVPLSPDATHLAIAAFAVAACPRDCQSQVAEAVGVEEELLPAWFSVRTRWPATALLALSQAIHEKWRQVSRNQQLESDLNQMAATLAVCFEELNLLNTVTSGLTLSRAVGELVATTIRLLHDGLGYSAAVDLELDEQRLTEVAGETSTPEAFRKLLTQLGSDELEQPTLVPLPAESSSAGVAAQWLVVPVADRRRRWGVIGLHNPRSDRRLGTVEANLLTSLGAILGTHCSNRDLAHQQQQFLEQVLVTLALAIEAKDPYTRGHSERVAQIAVILGRTLGLADEQLRTLRTGGLLHDIGKIGIPDHVLKKPGRLSDEEFAEIKRHPELGARMLAGLRPLAHLLPIVRFHHERWDGQGYPEGLAAEAVPRLARITAVADALDAMTSNRAYRAGMPLERVQAILREGSGAQWDRDVIEAYFRSQDEIHRVLQTPPDSSSSEGACRMERNPSLPLPAATLPPNGEMSSR